jgi:hypothetical protein
MISCADPNRARSQRRQQENHLGTPTSVVLARSSRTVQIESGLRHEWESEGVTCDIPLWTSSGRTEFTPDPLSAARERRKLQKQGIIVFDDTPKDAPHLYILPDKKHENGNGNGGSSRGGGARRGSMDSFDSSLYSMSSNSDDDSDTTQTSRRATSERAATPIGEHTKIEVPPFLSWATSDKQDESGENDEKTETSEYVERILEAIHESLKGQEPESKSKAYKRAREASQESVEKAYPLLLKDSSPESTSSPSVPQEESGASSSASPAQNKPPETNPHLSDPLHLILLKVANGKIRDLYQRFAELVGFYAPQPSGHAMISKCWGTFEMIMSVSIGQPPSHSGYSVDVVTSFSISALRGMHKHRRARNRHSGSSGIFQKIQTARATRNPREPGASAALVNLVTCIGPARRVLTMYVLYISAPVATGKRLHRPLAPSTTGCETTASIESINA